MNRSRHSQSRPRLVPPHFDASRVVGRAARLALLVLSGSLAHATTYWVSNSGNDANPGTSSTQPWATISKVNGTAFSPGDTILFARGDSWSGATLTVSSSGSAGGVITYGAWGSGAKPLLQNSSGNGIVIDGHDYVTVENLAVSHPLGSGVMIDSSDHVTIRSVDVDNNNIANSSSYGKPGIVASAGGYITITGCTVVNAASNGIRFKGTAGNPIHDSDIIGCTVTGTRSNDGITIHQGGTSADQAGSNFNILDNTCEGAWETGFDITTGTNVLVEGNVSRQNRIGSFNIGHYASSVTFRYHHGEDEPTANTGQTVKITARDVVIEYCTLIGSSTYNKNLINVVLGTPGEPTPENITIRNNTVVWNHSSAGKFLNLAADVLMETLTVKNNVFASRTSAKGTVEFAESTRPPNYATYDIDNNLYHGSTPTTWTVNGTGYSTFASYQAAFSRDTSGSDADPRFVDAANADFHLQAGSPAIDAGANVGVSVDFDGVSVPQGSGRDLGAFERIASLVLEAEALSVAGSSGETVTTPASGSASGGTYLDFAADGAGDSISFVVNVPVAQPYTILMGYLKGPDRGTCQLQIDGVDVSTPRALYNASTFFGSVNLGTVTLSAGAHTFTCRITGKSSGSSGYGLGLDTITLTP